jgi:cytochrome c oxidase subunit 1
MASIAAPQVYAPGGTKPETGLWSWLTTIDHKRIGLLYGVSAFFFFLLGGLEALLIRLQLAQPNQDIIGAARYNELFTMHGTTMIFLGVMPLSNAFFNYIIPLQIGARDVAFPRLNSFAFWTFLAGAIILNLSWFFNTVPNTGWYGYAPLTSTAWSPTHAVDFWVIGLSVLGISSMAGGFNFITTIVNMRAPGMTMMRLPVFSWATLVTQVLIIMSFPAITIGLFLLVLDRYAGTSFYEYAAGGDPLLWQHLFWIFGHPEVYILILPAFGIVSEIIPTFSRKPLFGYAVMVYAMAAIGLLGYVVWAHHMFTTGLGPTANAVFSGATMLIAIPTGVKIFNWVGTMVKGSLKFTTAMLFAVGLVSQFTIGGISGVMHASPLVDSHHNDTYFVIAHFHYVLFGGSVFGLIAATYYWFPKMSGRMMDEKLGKWNFWLTFIGFNATFFPMHFVGLAGMPRRYYTYGDGSGWTFWNMIVSIGAFVLGFSILFFAYNIAHSLRHGRIAGKNPWDAATLEWSTDSPPKVYNFAVIPTVTHRDQLWADKYGVEHGEELTITLGGKDVGSVDVTPDTDDHHYHGTEAIDRHNASKHGHDDEGDEPNIHMPNPSIYPLVVAIGLLIGSLGMLLDGPTITIGLLTLPIMFIAGLLVTLAAVYGWAFEPAG